MTDTNYDAHRVTETHITDGSFVQRNISDYSVGRRPGKLGELLLTTHQNDDHVRGPLSEKPGMDGERISQPGRLTRRIERVAVRGAAFGPNKVTEYNRDGTVKSAAQR